jgi:tetratricopeptide (TPR) repeat protein
MEILRKMATIALVVTSATLYGQNNKALQDAFTNSYVHEAQKNYAQAINDIQVAYGEGSYEMNLRLGWLHYMNANFDESVKYYRKAVALMPAATEPLWGIINPLSKQEKWNEVEKTYLGILKLDEKNTTANYRLGLIYYYRKDYVNAKKYFDVSLNLYPFDYDSMLMSAWTNFFLGKMSEARVLFNKVLLYKPNDSSALEGLGMIK